MTVTIKPEARAIADKLTPFIKHEGNGVITTAGAVEAALPDGMTADSLKQHLDFLNVLPVAATLATGEVSNALFGKLPELNETKATFEVAKNFSMDVLYQRTAEVAAGLGKDAGTKTVHGHATLKVDATFGKGAAYKNVRTYLSESLVELLK